MPDKDDCGCLVCAIRRDLAARYQDGLTDPVDVDNVLYALAGIVASIISARGSASLADFLGHYAMAEARLAERRSPRGPDRSSMQ